MIVLISWEFEARLIWVCVIKTEYGWNVQVEYSINLTRNDEDIITYRKCCLLNDHYRPHYELIYQDKMIMTQFINHPDMQVNPLIDHEGSFWRFQCVMTALNPHDNDDDPQIELFTSD